MVHILILLPCIAHSEKGQHFQTQTLHQYLGNIKTKYYIFLECLLYSVFLALVVKFGEKQAFHSEDFQIVFIELECENK